MFICFVFLCNVLCGVVPYYVCICCCLVAMQIPTSTHADTYEHTCRYLRAHTLTHARRWMRARSCGRPLPGCTTRRRMPGTTAEGRTVTFRQTHRSRAPPEERPQRSRGPAGDPPRTRHAKAPQTVRWRGCSRVRPRNSLTHSLRPRNSLTH
jgi:hypothetical protein